MRFLKFVKPIAKEAGNSNTKNQDYDFSSVESIKAIPIPKYEPLQGISSPVNNIEYILQRKATEFKRQGRMDLAIACLERSNEIMPHSNFMWSADDYKRLVTFLRIDNQFARADAEEKKLKKLHPELFEGSKTRNILFKKLQTDLFIFSSNPLCPYCSTYNDRVFSLKGKDNRFPSIKLLPENLRNTNCPECGFFLGVLSYSDEYIPKSELNADIKRSNSPFVDSRTQEQIALYKTNKEDRKRREDAKKKWEKDQIDYNWICKNLPDLAPKSFYAYKKMKDSNSTNYLNMVEKAKSLGYTIE